jgi:hypothetical protein
MKTFKQFFLELNEDAPDRIGQRREIAKDRTNLMRDKIKSNEQKGREKSQRNREIMKAIRDKVMSRVRKNRVD